MIDIILSQTDLWNLKHIWNWTIPIVLSIFGITIFIVNYVTAREYPNIRSNYEQRVFEKPYTWFVVSFLSPWIFYVALPVWQFVILTAIGYGAVELSSGIKKEWFSKND